MSQFQPFRLLLAASLLAFTAILGSLLSGSVDLSFSDLMSYVLGDLPDLQRQVFEDIRLPSTLAAFVTGAALALAGVLMQVLLRNPLADPYILASRVAQPSVRWQVLCWDLAAGGSRAPLLSARLFP